MSDRLVLIEFLLIMMLVAGAYFLWRGLIKNSRNVDTVFLLIITMFPVSFEGLYWIAAAARIVPSLFFIGLGIFSLRQYIEKDKIGYLITYIISSIFAVGFYEAFIPVYLIAVLTVVISSKKKFYLIAIPVFTSGIMALYYMANSQDVTISGRLEFVKLKDLPRHMKYVIEQYEQMLKSGVNLVIGSFYDGIQGILKYPVGGVSVILLSVALGVFAQPVKTEHKLMWLSASVALITGGTALNFVICFVRVPFRLFVLMIIGIALTVQVLFSFLPKIPYKIIAGLMALVFAVCNIGSLTLYKYTNERDTDIADVLVENYDVTDPQKIVCIINAPQYWYNDRVTTFEYVKAVTENYSTLTGQIQYITKTAPLYNITCLHEQNAIPAFPTEGISVLYLYYNGTSFEECTITFTEPHYDVVTQSGKTVGRITVTNNLFTYENIPQD